MATNLKLRQLHDILLKKGLTISCAESCTGGLLASTLTDLPSASHYFRGGIVCYSNEVKQGILGVSQSVIDKYGVVSPQVIYSMLDGCYKIFQTDIVCAVSGYIGPAGGTIESPVGTVFAGLKYKKDTKIEHYLFSGTRQQNKKSCIEQMILLILEKVEGL